MNSSYGDFVMLGFIAMNIDTSQFECLIHHLYENTETFLPHHNKSQTNNLLEYEMSPHQRTLPKEKTPRGKEL